MKKAGTNQVKTFLVLATLAILLIALILAAIITVRRQEWMINDRRTVMASYELSVQTDRLVILLQDAENAQRSFMLSGNAERKAAFEKTTQEIDPLMTRLRRMFAADPSILQKLQALQSDVDSEVARMRALVAAKEKSPDEKISPLSLVNQDQDVRARIRTDAAKIKEQQRFFRVVHNADLQRENENSGSELARLVVVALLAVAGCSLFAFVQWRAKDRAVALAENSTTEIAAAQERITRILATLDEGLYMLDVNGKVSYINPTGEFLLGYTSEELLGRDMHATIHYQFPDGTPRPAAECPLLNVIKSGITHTQQEDYFVRKDGTFLPVHYISSPLIENGKINGAVLAFFDISERKLDARRLKAQYEVTTILASGTELVPSVEQVIALLCRFFDWQFGDCWMVEGDKLRCKAVLPPAGNDYPDFRAITRDIEFAPGIGLAGRVWQSLKPLWLRDVQVDDNFPRREAATHDGLHAAFGVPIFAGNEFVAVLEFFSNAVREPDQEQLAMIVSVCSQVGQFVQRLRAAEHIALNEDRFRLALDGSQDAVWDWTIDTGEIFFSSRWINILGYDKDEMVFDLDSFMNQVHPDDVHILSAALDDHMEGRTEVYTCTFRVLNKAGEYVWIYSRGKGLRDAGGKMFRMAGSSRDISQERAAAEKLKQSEQKFKAIFDGTFEFIGLLNPEGFMIDVNRAAVEFNDLTKEAMLGRHFATGGWFFDKDIPRVQEALAKVRVGEFVRLDIVNTTDRGEELHIDMSLTPVFDSDGNVVMIIPEGRDISELKSTQARLSESEALFRQLAENIREIFWIATPDSSRFFYVSPAYEEITGRSIEGIADNPKSFFDVLEAEDRKKAFKDFHEFIGSPNVREGEYRVIRPDGEVRWIAAKVFPIHNDDGELVRICGVARDINDRKEAERRVSEFYSTVSHELRSPLTSIRGSLGLIENGIVGDVSDQALTFVTIARTESDRLIRLINNILDLRKIEAGKLELKISDVLIVDLIESTVAALQGMAAETSIELIAPIQTNVVAPLDRDLINQVLTNLISNAIKFSPEGGKVRVAFDETDPERIRFSVIDHGPGIPEAQAHKLFGKFQQLDSSDTRAKGGTGLGLAIAKAIVLQHGGLIGVDSVEGDGSTFWFTLPRVRVAVAQPETEAPKSVSFARKPLAVSPADSVTIADEEADYDVGTITEEHGLVPKQAVVLIVEDDPSTIAVVKQQLGGLGIRSVDARDAESGLALIPEEDPDLIILDIGLPKMDGFEFVAALRERKIDLPILVYSALDLTHEEKEEMSESMSLTRYLVKSQNSAEDLLSTVREMLTNLVPSSQR